MDEKLKIKVEKIVGVSDSQNWSQIHYFSPTEDDPKTRQGKLLAVFQAIAKKETLNLSSFGTEIIQRFQEIYYSQTGPNLLEDLKKSISLIEAEFSSDIELAVTAAVIKQNQKPVIYLAGRKGKVSIYRGEQLVWLLRPQDSLQGISGYLQPGDFLLVATDDFFRHLTPEKIYSLLKSEDWPKINESLAAMVGSKQPNSTLASALLTIEREKQSPPRQVFPKINWQGWFNNHKLKIFLKKTAPLGKKKVNITVAIILIFLLLVSIFLGFKKRISTDILESDREVLTKAQEQYQEALQNKEINPDRAKSLLLQAQEILVSYQPKSQEAEKLQQLKMEIEKNLEEVSREFKEEPTVFLDLNLVKSGFVGEKLALSGGKLAILDSTNGAIISVELESKKGKILSGGENIKKANSIGKITNFVLVVSEEKLLMIDDQNGKITAEKEINDLGKINDLVGFSGNAYLLGQNQIYKFSGVDSGLADSQEYLKKPSDFLKDSAAMAIDGSVWVLDKDGAINKFTRGAEDSFYPQGLEKSFNQPLTLFTDEECDNIYVLDQQNTRIVVLDKTGLYKNSYFWPGIAGVSDMVVDESLGNIFLLSAAKIYEFKLKQ